MATTKSKTKASPPGRKVMLRKVVGEIKQKVTELEYELVGFKDFMQGWMREMGRQYLAIRFVCDGFRDKLGMSEEEIAAYIESREKMLIEQEEALNRKREEERDRAAAQAAEKAAADAAATEGFIQPVDDWSNADQPITIPASTEEGGRETSAQGSDEAN